MVQNITPSELPPPSWSNAQSLIVVYNIKNNTYVLFCHFFRLLTRLYFFFYIFQIYIPKHNALWITAAKLIQYSVFNIGLEH